MGSFNATCFASQQIISPGERVVLIPVVQALGEKTTLIDRSGKKTEIRSPVLNHCYATAFWEYSGPLIYGSYYDYGRYELDTDPENMRSLRTLFDHVFAKIELVAEDDDKSSFDFSTIYHPTQQYTTEELLNVFSVLWEHADRDEDVYLNGTHYSFTAPTNFKFAAILQDSLEYLVDLVSKETTYGGKLMNEEFFIQEGIHRSSWQYLIENVIDNIPKDQVLTIDSPVVKSVMGMTGISYLDFGSGAHGITGNQPTAEECLELVNIFVQNGGHVSTEAIQQHLLKFQKRKIIAGMLHMGLDMISARIVPQTYTTQDYDNTFGDTFLNFVSVINAKVNTRVSTNDEYIDQEDGG